MSNAPGAGNGATLIVDFANNRLLGALFGEHDRYLARIEQGLGVRLVPRGNRLAISGSAAEAGAARDLLLALYSRLERGEEIGAGDIDGAIRLASQGEDDGINGPPTAIRTRKRRILPRSRMQARYLEDLYRFELVFALGPAGTGKTYLAVAAAVSMMLSGKVDRIVLSRPAIEAGERLGFLPGDMRDKVDPYLRPLYDALYDLMPADQVAKRMETGEIEIAPLAFMRGRTLSNAFVILDEGQNTTPVQMKMLLTRLGENSRMVVTGDQTQVDLPVGARSGLMDAVELLEGVEGIAFVRFSDADVVRHALVTRVVRAYAARDTALAAQRAERNSSEVESKTKPKGRGKGK
jgi:phosphate starvation-inducible protein PhoH and related proteins